MDFTGSERREAKQFQQLLAAGDDPEVTSYHFTYIIFPGGESNTILTH